MWQTHAVGGFRRGVSLRGRDVLEGVPTVWWRWGAVGGWGWWHRLQLLVVFCLIPALRLCRLWALFHAAFVLWVVVIAAVFCHAIGADVSDIATWGCVVSLVWTSAALVWCAVQRVCCFLACGGMAGIEDVCGPQFLDLARTIPCYSLHLILMEKDGMHGNCGRVPTDGPMRLASALGDDVASSLVSGRSVFRPGQLLGIPARTRG